MEDDDVPALTTRQAEILRFIRDAIEETGFPPTRAEITLAFNFRSPNAAEEHLQALARNTAIEMGGDTIAEAGPVSEGQQTFNVYRCQ